VLAALLSLLEAFPGDQGLMILAGVKGSGLTNLHSFFCRAGNGALRRYFRLYGDETSFVSSLGL